MNHSPIKGENDMKRIAIITCALLMFQCTMTYSQVMQVHTRTGGIQEFDLVDVDSITFITEVLYSEDFSSGAPGWQKIDGPGTLEVVNGTFLHTTVGFSVWCEYAYTGGTFGNAQYDIDVYVDSTVVSTSFIWRAPDLNPITGIGGAYQARFNNSDIAPGGAGHLIVEKFDPTGRVILLDIDNRFFGLNHLKIVDSGSTLIISIFNQSGTSGPHTIDVSAYTAAAPGYLFLVGGDRGGGDYFDNIVVR